LTRTLDSVGILAAVAYLGAVFYFGIVPSGGIPGVESDKAVHALCFFGMVIVSFPAALALAERRPGLRRHLEAWTALYGLAVGALIEIVQAGLPARRAELGDLGADALGVALAFALLKGARAWIRQPQS
jgi:VanZ family protein